MLEKRGEGVREELSCPEHLKKALPWSAEVACLDPSVVACSAATGVTGRLLRRLVKFKAARG